MYSGSGDGVLLSPCVAKKNGCLVIACGDDQCLYCCTKWTFIVLQCTLKCTDWCLLLLLVRVIL